MTRYAIYFIPSENSTLWQFGCAAIGYDSCRKADVPFHDDPFYARSDALALTEDPRRYGFHATLKPPFHLAAGTSVEALEAVATEFADARRPFTVSRLVVGPIGNFVALVPAEPNPDLSGLAGDCIEMFEPFRAPLSEADRERRLRHQLSDPQIAHLDRWGYPYVFDDYRFHMTLTGRLPGPLLQPAISALQGLYAPIDAPVAVSSICLCEQPSRDSRFFLRRRFEFGQA